MLPSLASVFFFLQEVRKKQKKTMPFHVCTDFKHARYAPNTLPRGMRCHENGTPKAKRGANRRFLSAAPPD